MTDKAYAVPLHELLDNVPLNERLVIDDPNGMGTRFIPIGRLSHEAAAELRRLHEVNAELMRVMDDLACWNDGAVGGHMDEPHAAFMARCALAFVESKSKGDSNGKT